MGQGFDELFGLHHAWLCGGKRKESRTRRYATTQRTMCEGRTTLIVIIIVYMRAAHHPLHIIDVAPQIIRRGLILCASLLSVVG